MKNSIDAGGRNITALPNSLDFGDILKFGTLGAGIGWIGPSGLCSYSRLEQAGPCVGGALGAAVVRLIYK